MPDLVKYQSPSLALRDRGAITDVREARRPARRALVRVGAARIVTEEAVKHIGELTAEEIEVCRRVGPGADARVRLVVDRFAVMAAVEISGLARWGEPR